MKTLTPEPDGPSSNSAPGTDELLIRDPVASSLFMNTVG